MSEVLGIFSACRPYLRDLHTLWGVCANPRWCGIGLSIICAAGIPEFKEISFLLHFWTTYLSGAGGGIISAILLMTPTRAPLSLLGNNFAGLQWVAVWWLMNFCPYGIVAKLSRLKPIQIICKACVHICRARLIMNRVDASVDLHPGVVMAPIVVGTISACGGKITTDTIKHAYGLTASPHEINAPSYSWRSSFLAALFYYFTVYHPSPLRLLAKEEAAAIMVTVFAAQSLLADLTGRPMDWTKPILTAMLTALNIPVPESCKFSFSSASPAAKGAAATQDPAMLVAASNARTCPTPASTLTQPARENGKLGAVNRVVAGQNGKLAHRVENGKAGSRFVPSKEGSGKRSSKELKKVK